VRKFNAHPFFLSPYEILSYNYATGIYPLSSGIIPKMLTKIARFAALFLVATLLAGCGLLSTPTPEPSPTQAPPTETPAPTPLPAKATVNGEVITVDEFNAELARYQAAQAELGRTVSDADASTAVLDDLIAQVLLAQGAKQAGFVVDDTLLQQRIDKLTSEVGGADALAKWQTDHGYTPGTFRAALGRAIAAAWMRDQIAGQIAKTKDQVHARQILFYNEDRARQVLGDIQAGRTDFDEFAALVDPVTRGDLGWFPRGYLPDKSIEQAAFALQPGQVSDVIKTDLGYHIIKVIERENRPLAPDALLALQAGAVQDWVTQQRTQSRILLAP
jgi:peptidyl-prolyl cis-trans isomerase C